MAPVEIIVRINPLSLIAVDSRSGDFPAIEIGTFGAVVVIMPSGPSDGRRITPLDVQKASELVMAASEYRNALAEAYAAQQGTPAAQPRRRPNSRVAPNT